MAREIPPANLTDSQRFYIRESFGPKGNRKQRFISIGWIGLERLFIPSTIKGAIKFDIEEDLFSFRRIKE